MFVVLALLSLSGCAFNGALRDDFHAPADSSHKIPLNVAIVADGTFMSARIKWRDVSNVEVTLNPGYLNAIRAELSSIFQKVSVIGDAGREVGAEAPDFLVYPGYDIKYMHPVKTSLVFKDPATQGLAFRYDAAGQNIRWMSGTGAAMAFLTGFTLFILSPITLPALAEDQGTTAIKGLEGALPRALTDMRQRIISDQRQMVAYAQGRKGFAVAAPLAVAAPSSTTVTIVGAPVAATAVTKPQGMAPTKFHYANANNPKDRREWVMMTPEKWIESLPDGSVAAYKVIGSSSVESQSGTVVRKLPDEKIEVFIPNSGNETMWISTRGLPGGEWKYFAAMEGVEIPLPPAPPPVYQERGSPVYTAPAPAFDYGGGMAEARESCVAACDANWNLCNQGCAGSGVADAGLSLLFGGGLQGAIEKGAKGGVKCLAECLVKKTSCASACGN